LIVGAHAAVRPSNILAIGPSGCAIMLTMTPSMLRQTVRPQAARMANQIVAQQSAPAFPNFSAPPPVAMEKKLESAETETAYLSMFRDGTNGGLGDLDSRRRPLRSVPTG